MSQNGGLIYADFYRTVFNCYAEDYMFSGEFFDKAKADADVLRKQKRTNVLAFISELCYNLYQSIIQKGLIFYGL